MKATIENRINTDYDGNRVLNQLNKIIDIILFAEDELHLQDIMKNESYTEDLFYFEWGFGGNHFWVKQKEFSQRIVIVNY